MGTNNRINKFKELLLVSFLIFLCLQNNKETRTQVLSRITLSEILQVFDMARQSKFATLV